MNRSCRTENYQLVQPVLENGLAALQVDLSEDQVELFASKEQHMMQLYCWQQDSSTGPAAPAPRGTTHYGGDAVGKRPHRQLRIDPLTGEWRTGEAGEGRGSEPCEPGGLCHQAGGASWRAPH